MCSVLKGASRLGWVAYLLLFFQAVIATAFAPAVSTTYTLALKASDQSHRRHMFALQVVSKDENESPSSSSAEGMTTILFVECGFGADAHGQDATKASVRACRNAIEFNQIPSIADIVPGGRNAMLLDVLLAVPRVYQDGLDLEAVKNCFPYGEAHVRIQDGGMIASNGKVIPEMGDDNMDMIVVCVAVTVGY